MDLAVCNPEVVPVVHVVVVVPIEDTWLVVQDCVLIVPVCNSCSFVVRDLGELIEGIGPLKTKNNLANDEDQAVIVEFHFAHINHYLV